MRNSKCCFWWGLVLFFNKPLPHLSLSLSTCCFVFLIFYGSDLEIEWSDLHEVFGVWLHNEFVWWHTSKFSVLSSFTNGSLIVDFCDHEYHFQETIHSPSTVLTGGSWFGAHHCVWILKPLSSPFHLCHFTFF